MIRDGGLLQSLILLRKAAKVRLEYELNASFPERIETKSAKEVTKCNKSGLSFYTACNGRVSAARYGLWDTYEQSGL